MGTRTAWIVALTGIGSMMAALGTPVVATALSTVRSDLGGAAIAPAVPALENE